MDHRVGAGDAELVALVPEAAAYVEREPASVLVARDADDALCGYSIAFPAGTASPLALADPRLGP